MKNLTSEETMQARIRELEADNETLKEQRAELHEMLGEILSEDWTTPDDDRYKEIIARANGDLE